MPALRKTLPPLDHFLAFEAAAKSGSFARASLELHISESAISRKVRLLEQHFNQALFVRGHRSITLTEQGRHLLTSVSRSMDILRDASTDMIGQTQNNPVRLAATNSVAALWLMPRLRRFNRANAQVKIMLTASDSDEECLGADMDLTILRGDGDWPGYESRLLFGETVFPVCAPRYLKRTPKAADAQALPGLDLIEVASSHTEWMNWRTWLGHHGIAAGTLDRSAMFNTYPLAIQAAQDGLGIALGWGHLVDHLLDSGELVRPLPDHRVRTKSGYFLLKSKRSRDFAERQIVEDWLLQTSATRKRYAG